MNNQDDDRDLRETFASMRREDRARVPNFHRLLTHSPALSPGTLAPAGVVVTVLVLLGLAIGLVLQPFEPVAPPELSLAAWTEPTAFLLRTPGHDFLSTVPAFGRDMPSVDLNDKGVPRHE